MAEAKTKPGGGDVEGLLQAIADPARQADARRVCALMEEVSGRPPVIWGGSMVGFGSYSYTYASGHSGEWFEVGFAPRKANLTLYLVDGFERREELLGRLGKHSTGKACLYVKSLGDVDTDVLRELVEASVAAVR